MAAARGTCRRTPSPASPATISGLAPVVGQAKSIRLGGSLTPPVIPSEAKGLYPRSRIPRLRPRNDIGGEHQKGRPLWTPFQRRAGLLTRPCHCRGRAPALG